MLFGEVVGRSIPRRPYQVFEERSLAAAELLYHASVPRQLADKGAKFGHLSPKFRKSGVRSGHGHGGWPATLQ